MVYGFFGRFVSVAFDSELVFNEYTSEYLNNLIFGPSLVQKKLVLGFEPRTRRLKVSHSANWSYTSVPVLGFEPRA